MPDEASDAPIDPQTADRSADAHEPSREQGGHEGGDQSGDVAEGSATSTGADAPAPAESNASGEGESAPKKRRRRRRKKRPMADGEPGSSDPKRDGEGRAEGAGAAGGDGAGSARAEGGTDRSGPPRAKKARSKKKRTPPPSAGGRGAAGGHAGERGHHAQRAVRALSEMAAHLLEVEGVDPLARPRWMDVRLRVPLDAGRDGAAAANAVTEQILDRVRQVREHERALVPGAVYSYFHERADAEGCRPEDPRQVFDGYTSTGRPRWTDFVTLAIDRKSEGIDELVEGEDIVVAHVTMGQVLRTQQLVEFGRRSPVFRLLGQVDAGLFPVLRSGGKAAFSIQLLSGSTLEGKPRLRLHPVGAAELTDLADPSVAQILYRFQQRLDNESLRLSGMQANGKAPLPVPQPAGDGEIDREAAAAHETFEEEFVLPLLTDLARQLSGRARRKNRRTDHAAQRSEEGQRPTAKAFGDAKQAGDDAILCDDVQDTIVVLGAKNRVHVFTHDAKHVTSLVMQAPAVRGRRNQGRWRTAEADERGNFRIGLSQRLGQGEGDEPDGG